MRGGITASPEATDPLPLYLRGAYFDGVKDFMTIAGGLILNHSFTLRTWAKVLDTNGRFFSINRNDYAFIGAEEYLQWGYNIDRQTFKFSIGTEVILEHTTRS